MQTLHGYTVDETLWKAKGGGGQCNTAKKDGKKYFIKRLAFPRYPDSDNIKGLFIQKKIDICNEWYRRRQEIIRAIPGSGTGTIVKPIEYFREGPCYYEVANMIDVTSIPYDEIYKESKEDRARIMLTVAMSLADLHKKGIVHGDLDPGNILISRVAGSKNLVTKLIDFTDSFFENDPPETIVSKDFWWSPEVALYSKAAASGASPNPYKKYISCKADVFSLGIVFHQYCTKGGKPPICTKAQPWQEFNAGKTPQIDSNIEPEFRSLIADMLECEPSKRPAMADVHKRLFQILKSGIGEKNAEEEQKNAEKQLNEMEEHLGESVASGCVEQDMLCDEEFYDLIFVINKAELTKGWLKDICDNVSRFAQGLPCRLLENKKVVLPIRAKIIWYGDIYLDGDNAIGESKYYWLPDDLCSFEHYIQSEKPIPGCEKPESGIEALCLAIESLSDSKAIAGTIILCSEFGAYGIDILQMRGQSYNPMVRPTDMGEFVMGWNDDYVELLGERRIKEIEGFTEHDITKWRYCGCTSENRFLILYTPLKYPWSEFEYELERCIRVERFEDALEYAMEFLCKHQPTDLGRHFPSLCGYYLPSEQNMD